MEINRKRYVVSGFFVLLVLGLLYAWSVFVIPIENEFGWTRGETSLTFSISMICFSLGLIVSGSLISFRGPKTVAVLGGIFVLIGFALASFTKSLIELYIFYGVIGGLAIGVTYNCALSTAIKWYPDKRGLISGVLTMGFGLGGLILGSGANVLINMFGWRNTLRICGILSFLIVFVLAQILIFPKRDSVFSDSDNQQLIENNDATWREMLKTPAFWTIWFWQIFIMAGGLGIIGHSVPYAIENGIDEKTAVLAMGLLSVFNGAGRLVFGILWDKIGRTKAMVIDASILCIALGSINFFTSRFGFIGLIIPMVLCGMAYGGMIPLASSITAYFYGNKNFSINYGFVTTAVTIGAVLGPYMSGHIKAITGQYDIAFYILSGFAFISVILSILIKKPKLQG